MNLPQIRLESNYAKIKMNTQQPIQEIEQPKAELDIQQPAADLEINRTPSKLTINQTKAREDIDLKSIFKRMDEAAQLGYEGWLEGIARRSQEGDELMKIENGGNIIAEQAARNAYSPMLEFNIGWLPHQGSVEIGYDPGKVEINVTPNKPIIKSRINKPNIQYTPGKVNISLKQYNSLKIDFENLKYVGINYEQSI
ncbi:DUF6470 family protein [Neobacillus sp. D3-1R]|uniref:DUF6470 family protein n=1 Tax=Neobacillus sp. D3-1R TaxID=3445778 RepID=UPI003FA04F6B